MGNRDSSLDRRVVIFGARLLYIGDVRGGMALAATSLRRLRPMTAAVAKSKLVIINQILFAALNAEYDVRFAGKPCM